MALNQICFQRQKIETVNKLDWCCGIIIAVKGRAIMHRRAPSLHREGSITTESDHIRSHKLKCYVM